MPASVKVSRIAVRDVSRQADQTVAQLDLAVFAKNPSTIDEMIRAMHQEGVFLAQIRNQNLQKGRGEAGTEYELTVIYRARSSYSSENVAEVDANEERKRGSEMSAELPTESRSSSTTVYRSRVSEFLASRRGKMFGVAEVVALAGSCFVLALVLLSYLYFLVPARSRLASLNTDLKQTQTNLQTLDNVFNKDQNTKQTVDRTAASLNKFETEHLMRSDEGHMDSFRELNELIVKNNLKNTSGPTYTPLIQPERSQTRERLS